MASPFSWPMLVPSSLRLPAPVNQGVRPPNTERMNHKQLLGHLAAGELPTAMALDISRLASWAMLGAKPRPHNEVQSEVVNKFLRRWNCVFKASTDEVTDNYRDKAWIISATTLHKFGFIHPECTERALQAIDKLNNLVALSDYFFTHAEQAKDLLRSPPSPLKRRPSIPDDVTFFRKSDVVSYQLDGSYYVCYVQDVQLGNAAPLIEFFNIKLNRPPTMDDISGAHAVGGRYNDGVRRIEMYWVYGMRSNPDLANQFKLIQAGCNTPPLQTQLAPPVGGGSVIDIFKLQDAVDRSF